MDAADECDAKDSILENLEEICQNEGFGHSTWTIDLCYLLKHYAPRLAFSYTTITLGVDPTYMNQVGLISMSSITLKAMKSLITHGHLHTGQLCRRFFSDKWTAWGEYLGPKLHIRGGFFGP